MQPRHSIVSTIFKCTDRTESILAWRTNTQHIIRLPDAAQTINAAVHRWMVANWVEKNPFRNGTSIEVGNATRTICTAQNKTRVQGCRIQYLNRQKYGTDMNSTRPPKTIGVVMPVQLSSVYHFVSLT